MAVAGRRAFSSLLFRSKSKSLENFIADPWSMRRSMSFCSSDSKLISAEVGIFKQYGPPFCILLKSLAIGLKQYNKIEDSLEFVEWHNGGGLYHRTALIEPSVRIGIGAIVHEEAIVGADVNIGSGSIVGPSVSVGQSTTIGYNAVLSNCSVGQSCVIHNGVCIGQDGFGFFVDDDGNMMKKPQMLYVKIGDHVEIGANTCIDRGSWRDTVVGDHTKIDNLVQIGHNVIIGKCCMLCGQVGIAGSVTMGDYCTLGGRVAVKDHCAISSKVRVAGHSVVTKDIPVPGDYGGCPAMPIHQWRRETASIRRLCKSSHQRSE